MTFDNTTLCDSSLYHCYPFYHVPRPSIVPGVSDQALTVAAPVLAYWLLSSIFHIFDVSGWKWLERFRIHDSVEVSSRNLASRFQVLRAVILQQVIQTVLGIFWLEGDDVRHSIDHPMEVRKMERALGAMLSSFVGSGISSTVHSNAGPWLAWL